MDMNTEGVLHLKKIKFLYQGKCHYYECDYILHYYNEDTRYICRTDFS